MERKLRYSKAKGDAQRQRERRERIRSDPALLQQYRNKAKEHSAAYRERNNLKAKSDREVRMIRKYWRTTQQTCRQRKQRLLQECSSCTVHSENTELDSDVNTQVPVAKSKQVKCGRKKVRRDRSSMHRKLVKLAEKLVQESIPGLLTVSRRT